MAKVNPVSLCRACGLEITYPAAPCPRCGHGEKREVKTSIETPDYVALQIQDAVNQIDPKRAGEYIERTKQKLAIEQAFWFRNCDQKTRKAAMQDARNVLRGLIHTDTPIEQIRDLARIGKHIGELAQSIDQYFSKGGLPNVSATTGPTDYSEDPESP